MTINQTPSPNSATPTRARDYASMSTHLAQPVEFRARYRLGAPGTTVIHLSARDFTDLGLDPNARTIHLFGATFTRLEKI